MPGMPGGLQTVESEPGNEDDPAGNVPEPAGSFDRHLQAGQIQRNGRNGGGNPNWFFFPDQCRHCLYPLCKMAADRKAKGAIAIDSRTRAVTFNPAVKISPEDFKEVREICPFDIPRYDEKSGGMSKCTMCFDRISEGMLPACVKACPTGTMNFGDRDAILKMAENRLDEVRIVHRRASLIVPESVRVIFLVKDDPEKYYEFAAEKHGSGNTRMTAMERLLHLSSLYGA